MTKEKYMALADLQTVWTNSIKPWIVAGFIAVTPVAEGATAQLVLQDGSLLPQSTFQPAGNYVLASEKGAANGVATLGADGKVPASQLPSYVDDVIEAANFAALPETGEAGKIYVTLDDNKTYRWGGTAYVVISDTIAIGETQGTAYEGSKGKQVADNLAAHTGNTDIHVTTSDKAAWNAKYDKPTGGIPKTDLADAVGASLDLADTAYQKPSTGIAKSDLAQGVQDSLDLADSALQASDIAGKADKVSSAVADNFAGLDANGNLKDSGKKASDFATAAQGDKADSAIQTVKVNGTALTPDANKAVNVEFEIPERVTAAELATFVV